MCKDAPPVSLRGFSGCKEDAPPVGYVRVEAFTLDSPEVMAKVLQEEVDAGARRFVLDVRGNPGGILFAGARIASQFLGPGAPLATLRAGGAEAPYDAPEPGVNANSVVRNAQIAIIVDRKSASTSELIAAGLRASGRASVVGSSTTYGKGFSQTVKSLATGADLLVTTVEFATPGGERIEGVGIKPDIRCDVNQPVEADPCLATAFRTLEKR
eukprot:gnl/MRDRNA2_/MRDRNA2_308609_c0_seq1.p1 gnl/MRDRNA2_/MRDRNA2_308609_c0~~gnl/MRDRNA2_/MRDRNA2_308609_c0_seq1.p1  ORF type:complete len:213 (-),score=38.44 gnl/MRDRNA2_/MRDRNA2_308609_c0_seq1:87-725(-)